MESYPRLSFTCTGGPLNGAVIKFAHPNRAIWKRSTDGPDIPSILAAESFLCTTYRKIDGRQVKGVGRYKITLDETAGVYSAVHVPSADDLPFPESQPFTPAVSLPPNTLGL